MAPHTPHSSTHTLITVAPTLTTPTRTCHHTSPHAHSWHTLHSWPQYTHTPITTLEEKKSKEKRWKEEQEREREEDGDGRATPYLTTPHSLIPPHPSTSWQSRHSYGTAFLTWSTKMWDTSSGSPTASISPPAASSAFPSTRLQRGPSPGASPNTRWISTTWRWFEVTCPRRWWIFRFP